VPDPISCAISNRMIMTSRRTTSTKNKTMTNEMVMRMMIMIQKNLKGLGFDV
jgi:hypothetical protein